MQKPIKQEVLDPKELLREAEEQAGDDGGEQVACSLALQGLVTLTETQRFTPLMLRTMSQLCGCCADSAGCQRPQASHTLL